MGFFNSGKPGQLCNEIKYESMVGMQRSIMLSDNLLQVAQELNSHPMIKYPEHLQEPTANQQEMVNETWARLSGSCAFWSNYGVFLCATRTIFYTGGERDWPVISFVRGQIFDRDWVHLDNYTIQWKAESVKFPVVFDIPSAYELGGYFYGPEDPRIIIEDAQDAEPVIIFNMVGEPSIYVRAMWIYRPFSGHTTRLSIRDTKLALTEKNWMPFFLSLPRPTSNVVAHPYSKASSYLHFVYDFKPLRILKCHLVTGECMFVFQQNISDGPSTMRHDVSGTLRGGTNFVPIRLPPVTDLQSASHLTTQPMRAYLGFPRASIEGSCPKPFYRPQLVIMVTNGIHYHLAYASYSLEFGSSLFDPVAAAADPCGAGRIVIANSIAQWDTDGRDIMTVTFSVADRTVQVARLKGVLEFVAHMPGLIDVIDWRKQSPSELSAMAQDRLQMQYSEAGNDVRFCSLQAVWNYTVTYIEKRVLPHPKTNRLGQEQASPGL